MREQDYLWLRQTILSCKQPFQFRVCGILISQFYYEYAYDPGINDEYRTLINLLEERNIPVIVEGL